jgi:hypothetical protein
MVSTDLSVGPQGQAASPAASSGARSAHHAGLLLPAVILIPSAAEALCRQPIWDRRGLPPSRRAQRWSSWACSPCSSPRYESASPRPRPARHFSNPTGDGGGRNPPLGELRLLIHPVPDH